MLFLVNAISFMPVIGAVARWQGRSRPATAAAPEHVREAIRAGGRYVTSSPALRVILLRAGLFMFFANSIWALLPLVAHTAAPRLRGVWAAARRCRHRRSRTPALARERQQQRADGKRLTRIRPP